LKCITQVVAARERNYTEIVSAPKEQRRSIVISITAVINPTN